MMEPFLKDGIYYVAVTPERQQAIQRAIRALREEQREHRGIHTYPSKSDFEIERAMDALETMLREAKADAN